MSSSISVSSDDIINCDISIIDQPAQFEKDKSKIIAGLWHTITFSGISNTDQELFLTVFKGSNVPTVLNETNYYEWKYTPTTVDPWEIVTSYGNSTIFLERCSVNSNSVSFCVGIPDHLPSEIFYNELWTIELTTNNNRLYGENFYLEKPTRGFAKSHGDRLSFSVDPFTVMTTKASDYLILKNTGNVPLNITLDFKAMDQLLTYTESSEQIPAKSQQNYRLVLNAESWKPQRIQQVGTASAFVSEEYLLNEEVSGTAISLQTALVIDVPTINIFVGHKSYSLTTLQSSTGLSFQYQKSISMNEGESRTINSYISGEGIAKITIQNNDNISILELNKNGLPANSPISVVSTNDEEQIISIKLKALSENRDGKITYIIESDGDIDTFTTKIDIGPPKTTVKPEGIGDTSPVTLIVLFALIIAAAYMLYNHLIHGKGERR